MAAPASLLLLCLLATTQASTTVSVFYESLCPYSIAFLTLQFKPTYDLLGAQHITVDYLPYGKAQHELGSDGQWNFTCQHGPDECRGNVVQACALHYITEQDAQVDYIDCLMSSAFPPDAGPQCATLLGVDYTPISECAESSEGELLLVHYGERTHGFFPPILVVPTIVYDGVFDLSDHRESLTNFLGVVCRHLEPQPPECFISTTSIPSEQD